MIHLRSGQFGVEAAQALVEDLPGLSALQRTRLHDMVNGVANRAPTRPPPSLVIAEKPGQPVIATVAEPSATRAPEESGRTGSRVSRTAVTTLLHPLAMKAREQLDADVFQVYIEDDDVLTLRAEARAEGTPALGTVALRRDGGLLAQVDGLERAVALGHLGELTGDATVWASRGVKSLAVVGVGTAGATDSGILLAGRRSMLTFSDRELAELDRLAIEVSSAMASADLLSRAEELAVLTERMRLAREIHDGLASDLSAVVALFKYHDHRRKSDPADAERLLQQMRDLVEGALQSARDILATLRPRQQPPVNLIESVRRQVEDFAGTYGVSGTTHIEGEGVDLGTEERDAFYQILKEALSNIRKHSDATALEVRLDLANRPYTLQVDDDGVGVDANALNEKRGSFGLMGMRERAELLGGGIEIGNGPMGGARVTFRGPRAPLGNP